MRYPTRLLTDGEEILHQFRPHWRVLIPALGWAMLFAALAGAAFAALDTTYGWWAAGLGVVLWVVLSIRRLLTYWFTNYVLTTERIIVRTGMVARQGSEIPLENINNVLFTQTVAERLLGYGDILVESAGQTGQTRFEDIPDPEAFQSEIYRARELRTLHFKSGGASGRARDVVEQLEALADLKERGHLTDEEFTAKKARLLGELPGVTPADVEELMDEGDIDPSR
ncbi:MAG: PH domain-containing protein [Nitriliruptoraceae bacterium]|nr:PH domain-containing protein [Nitriliruptoraceae bacterium]